MNCEFNTNFNWELNLLLGLVDRVINYSKDIMES